MFHNKIILQVCYIPHLYFRNKNSTFYHFSICGNIFTPGLYPCESKKEKSALKKKIRKKYVAKYADEKTPTQLQVDITILIIHNNNNKTKKCVA